MTSVQTKRVCSQGERSSLPTHGLGMGMGPASTLPAWLVETDRQAASLLWPGASGRLLGVPFSPFGASGRRARAWGGESCPWGTDGICLASSSSSAITDPGTTQG